MVRLLGAGFLAGLAVLVIGLLLVQGAAWAAGDWWQARQPWIGAGLNAIVIGLAVVHLTAPLLTLAQVAPNAARAITAFLLLIPGTVIAVVLWVLGYPPLTLIALLLTFVGAWVVLARSQSPTRGIAAAIVLPGVWTSSFLVGGWWLLVLIGGWLTVFRRPGPSRPPASLLEDIGTLIYSAPEYTVVVPGLPTIALVVMAVATLVARRRRPAAPSRQSATADATDAAVLT